MNQKQKAGYFAGLHRKGDPCVLYNVWDAGSAQAVAKAGALAIATGSASVAAAHGYADGQAIPLALVETIAQRISASVTLPVSVDFEGGYAEAATDVAVNVARIVAAGAVGINFEDQVVHGDGRYDIATQCERIAAIREAADRRDIPLFINARTDVFLQAAPGTAQAELIGETMSRATAYEHAGASGFFAPKLVDAELIAALCHHTTLPVNILMMQDAPLIPRLAELGVSRISFGPAPFTRLMQTLTEQARSATS